MVITERGIVATSHTLASQAGAQILARGGSAVDAAIAANAALSVTEPMMCGPGGDLFVIYWEAKTGKLTGINASGWAPKNLTIDFLRGKDFKQMPASGIHSVTVPGAVDGWGKLHKRFGKLAWKGLFGAAIHYAERGYPVPELVQSAWGGSRVSSAPESKRVFLPGGKAPGVGDVFRNPDLGRMFRELASGGSDAFYRGEIAQAILRTSGKLGGTLAAEDLAEFSAEWVTPISTEYRGWRVYELPPNGQGIAALQMLNMLERFQPARAPHGVEELHKKIEAMKLAYADLRPFVSDPRFSKPPVEQLLSKKYAAARATLINSVTANCDAGHGSPVQSDTTYLAVVDAEGNIASWIQSISAGWGSGVVVEGMGFQLQNRGGGFTIDPKHPNALAPRKRPYHTIIPAFMEKGDLHIGFGIMGGLNQPTAHAQFVSHFVDYEMNLQAAMEAPRFTKRVIAPSCAVSIESRVTPEVISRLREMGHKLTVEKEHSMRMGRGQAVMHNAKTKVNFGASDSRADGSAEPEPLL